MNKKTSNVSVQILVGAGLLLMGVMALLTGHHDTLSQALTPFGIGLILSDVLTRFGKATRETVKILIRRDLD